MKAEKGPKDVDGAVLMVGGVSKIVLRRPENAGPHSHGLPADPRTHSLETHASPSLTFENAFLMYHLPPMAKTIHHRRHSA